MNDAIDFYPEYTGTGLLVLLKTFHRDHQQCVQKS